MTVPLTVQLLSILENRIVCRLKPVSLDTTFPNSTLGVKDVFYDHLLRMHCIVEVLSVAVLRSIATYFGTYKLLSSVPVTLRESSSGNPTLATVNSHQDVGKRTLCVIRILGSTSIALIQEFYNSTLCKGSCTVQLNVLSFNKLAFLTTTCTRKCGNFFFIKREHNIINVLL